MSRQAFRILIVDQDAIRASLICEGLAEAGHHDVTVVGEMQGLARRIEAMAPDIIIIDLANPHRDLVEHLFQISRLAERPVAMFVDRSDDGMLAAAIEAGVSAYVVDGLRKDRISPIVDMAIARFNAYAQLRRELAETRAALADRKAIDRAKALLMRARALSEQAAHALIRSSAMRSGRKMGDVARALLLSADLLDNGTAPPPEETDHDR